MVSVIIRIALQDKSRHAQPRQMIDSIRLVVHFRMTKRIAQANNAGDKGWVCKISGQSGHGPGAGRATDKEKVLRWNG